MDKNVLPIREITRKKNTHTHTWSCKLVLPNKETVTFVLHLFTSQVLLQILHLQILTLRPLARDSSCTLYASECFLSVMAQVLDFSLRCNNLSCRTALTEKAVVTTCSWALRAFSCFPGLSNILYSHIFCLRCASQGGLSQSQTTDRQCPACQSSLPNPDDVVSTILTPTEDYKTSVLSGLDPATIIECAGRALSFWTYQATQEMYGSYSPSLCLKNSEEAIERLTNSVQILPRPFEQDIKREMQCNGQTDGSNGAWRKFCYRDPPTSDIGYVTICVCHLGCYDYQSN